MFGGLEDSLRTPPSTKSSRADLWPKTVAYKLRANAGKELTCHPSWHIQKIELLHGGIRKNRRASNQKAVRRYSWCTPGDNLHQGCFKK